MTTRRMRVRQDGAATQEAVAADAWHALPANDVLARMNVGTDGLPASEARWRLARDGPNALDPILVRPAWRVILDQLRSTVVLLLLVATGVALALGDRADALAILAVLALNAALGAWTELRARSSMRALMELQVPRAVVRREGRSREIDAREVVVGDVLVLEEGGRVPADARLLETAELRTDEAPLTGESRPVTKDAAAVLDAAAPLADRRNMAYLATSIATGRGVAVVTATGPRTEVGRVGALVGSLSEQRTLLERRLESLGRRLALFALLAGAIVGLLALLQHSPAALVLETALVVAIAAVPEGLPAIVTIAMAIGTRRMAARRAIVRHLPAVESLGSITVVCTDKTGTLTAGKQVVTDVWSSSGEVELVLEVAALASRGECRRTTDGWETRGDPTDVACLMAACEHGIERDALLRRWPRIGELPFSSARMLAASFHRASDGTLVAFAKGAPRALLQRSTWRGSHAGSDTRARIERENDAMAARGLRVLAVARGTVADPTDEALRDLTLLGLVGITDPPADGVRRTVTRLREAGLRTVMITGDQAGTAAAIGRELGVVAGGDIVLDATRLAAMTDRELDTAVERTAAFSRVSPEDKLRIVEALQRRGDVVAMIGDGVNDAAALRRADIGVAMGGRGTDVARESAGIVLADDRFETIAFAVEEGRVILDNVRKFVFFLFSCNAAELLALTIAGAAGLPLPATPLQILWMNLVTDSFPALALALEPAEGDVMRRRPRAPSAPLLSAAMLRSIGFYATLIAGVTLVALVGGLRAWPEAPARAVTLSFSTLVLAQLFHLGNARSREAVATRSRALSNPYAAAAVAITLVFQVAALTWPPLRRTLGTESLPLAAWGAALALGIVPGVVGQVLRVLGGARKSASGPTVDGST